MPSYQRQGFGKLLVNAATNRAVSRRIGLMTVKTNPPGHPDGNSPSAWSFYFSVGFLPFEQLPDHWGPGRDCLIMVKALTGRLFTLQRNPVSISTSIRLALEFSRSSRS
ncbi:MAG: hypothetical protein JJ872_13725 [Marivivens sp.]|nr:hypothetical protein [Marivivens sp.]